MTYLEAGMHILTNKLCLRMYNILDLVQTATQFSSEFLDTRQPYKYDHQNTITRTCIPNSIMIVLSSYVQISPISTISICKMPTKKLSSDHFNFCKHPATLVAFLSA
jgi:hypothetical protein